MKFNIEVEIDWLREGDNIDDVVKQSIIDGVVRKLSGGLIKQITDKAMDRVNKKLDELVLNLFEKVNKEGIASNCGADRTRLQYMLDSRETISKAVEEMTKKVVAEVDAKISKRLNDEIKSRLSNSLLEKIDVDGIIGNVIKGFKG